MLFSVDHHRGSEENQAGWDHHDNELVDPATGRMDTLPFFRRTIVEADLERSVIGVVGDSAAIAAASVASALERTLELGRGGPEVRARLQSVPGVGPWSADETSQRTNGDPASVGIGD